MSHLPAPTVSNSTEVLFFEHKKLGLYQQGMAVYEAFIEKGQYSLEVRIHDIGILFLDGKAV